jgi:hypothetical protein
LITGAEESLGVETGEAMLASLLASEINGFDWKAVCGDWNGKSALLIILNALLFNYKINSLIIMLFV